MRVEEPEPPEPQVEVANVPEAFTVVQGFPTEPSEGIWKLELDTIGAMTLL